MEISIESKLREKERAGCGPPSEWEEGVMEEVDRRAG